MFKTAYGEKVRSQLDTGKESMTQQNFKRECDINNIMKKFHKTGLVDHVSTYQGDYSDISSVPSFQDALNIVQSAQEAFDSLPSSIRKKFANDPAAFLEFVHDPQNADEMIDLGLRKPQEIVAPVVEEQPAPVQPTEEAK